MRLGGGGGEGGRTGWAQRQGAQATDGWDLAAGCALEAVSGDPDRWIRSGRLGSSARGGQCCFVYGDKVAGAEVGATRTS
jgi:hypothetical protein